MIRISIQNIHKKFKIGFKKRQGILARIILLFTGKEQKKEIKILNDISLEIESGEIIGIIGNNGSGKSTLLRLIAGIYTPDSGDIKINGKIISIINLGTALKERLTMKENIFLVGSLFGMNQKEIKERFDSIVNFSELNDFIYTKIYQFSAGMIQRLAFSIAIYSNPEILLLDEVFEVGDENFKKKSAEKIKKMSKEKISVVFVTHDLDMIKRQCSKVVWIADGKIKMIGEPDKIIKHYVEQTN